MLYRLNYLGSKILTKRMCLVMITIFPKFLVELFFSFAFKLSIYWICKILFFEYYEKFTPNVGLDPMNLKYRVPCSTD